MTALPRDLAQLDPAAVEPLLRDPWAPPEAPLAMPSQTLERPRGWLLAALIAAFVRPRAADTAEP